MMRTSSLVPLLTLLACEPPPEVQLGGSDSDSVEAFINITYPADEQEIALYGNGSARFAVAWEFAGLDFVPENSGNDPTGVEGHVHLYVGGETFYPETTATEVVLSGLSGGDRLDVELFWAGNNHVEDGTLADVVHINMVDIADLTSDTESDTDGPAESDTDDGSK